jgi:hypothetical protein
VFLLRLLDGAFWGATFLYGAKMLFGFTVKGASYARNFFELQNKELEECET